MPDDSPPLRYVGQPMPRLEDAALLRGQARFADDLPVRPGTLHAAILRSPHAHAEILGIDTARAEVMAGVACVVTGADAKALSAPFLAGVRTTVEHWCLAIDTVRYVGEPVAVVVADDRYRAEDALDAIAVRYRPLPPVLTVEQAEQAGGVIAERSFRYGDPDAAFAAAAHRVGLEVFYPRSSCSPIECYVVIAEFADGAYDVTANFSGPFAVVPVMARALKVPLNRLRLKLPPYSGGSFGIKQAIFPYIVLMGVAARKAGRPVKWVEDRLEHLMAATSATARRTRIEAAVDGSGKVHALRLEQADEVGAYLRAPEPATQYRNHGNLTGAYDIRHLEVRNSVVLTNKTPTGLSRGFGGGQLYLALERLMQRIAVTLGLDPLEVIRRNLITAFPYATASGGVIDSGDYQAVLAQAAGHIEDLRRRRERARAGGRLYGIGYAAVVEPSISNMGYITTVLTPEERAKAGPKNGAQATATVGLDPAGGISVTAASAPQGQGHRTVLAQVVAEVLGVAPEAITVNTDLDTAKDAWSIASGNYSSRFAGAVAGAAHLAATRLRDKLARIASEQFNCRPAQVGFAGGQVFDVTNPRTSRPFSRIAAAGHWAPGTLPDDLQSESLRETATWTPPQLMAPSPEDAINSSGTYGFVFDACGVEIDRDTGHVRIDKYVTCHDAGRMLNPLLVDGQVYGAFAQGFGAALLEEFVYGDDGRFLSGTLADYLMPTAPELPELTIMHADTPTEATPLGAKGVGEGNNMSTPVCLANAVADALGIADIPLPITPSRLVEWIHGAETERPPGTAPPPKPGGRGLNGSGSTKVPASPQRVWDILLDPDALAGVLPGCEKLVKTGDNAYRAEVVVGIGPVRGRYLAEVALSELDPPHSLTLSGQGTSSLGTGSGSGQVRLEAIEGGTVVHYSYTAEVGGKVAAVGGRMLEGASRLLIGQFFDRLVAKAAGGKATGGKVAAPWWRRLLRLLGVGS